MGIRSSKAAPSCRLGFIKDFLRTGPIGVAGVCDIIIKYADSFEGSKMLELQTGSWFQCDLAWVDSTRITVCCQSQVQVWDVLSNTVVHSFCDQSWLTGDPVVIGTKLMVRSFNTVHMWNLETGHYELAMTFPATVDAMVALDHERVVMNCIDSSMYLWNVVTGLHERTWTNKTTSLVAISGQTFATGSIMGTVRLWDARQLECTQELYGHSCSVDSLVRLSPTKCASGSLDCTVRIWDLESGKCSMVIVAHEEPLHSLACLDPFTIVSCAQGDHYVRAWSVDTGAPTWTLKHNRPTRLAVGGNKLAVCETPREVEGRVVVWN